MQSPQAWHEHTVIRTKKGVPYYRYQWKGKFRKRYLVDAECGICNTPVFADRGKFNKRKHSFCSKKCQYEAMSGSKNPNWVGGIKFKRGSKGGHILQYAPEHPGARRKFVPQHRLIVEKALGRFLKPNEYVHHINCDPQDNRIENLCIVDKWQHNASHNSLELCVKVLMEKGFLTFSKERHCYEVPLNPGSMPI